MAEVKKRTIKNNKIIPQKMNKKQLKFNKRNLAIFIVLTNFIIILSSCSKDWSCPAEKGFSCRNISQVDGGDMSSNDNNKKHKKQKGRVNKNLLTNNTLGEVKIDELHPIRTQEKIGRILITPYVDKEGNLNSGKYIYTIDEKPEWRI